ncbi:ankyrin repeat domain-containing protein 26 isoform X1 [Lissotriton helveticus]
MCAVCQDTVADASGPRQGQSCSCNTPQLCPPAAPPCRAHSEPPDAASRLLFVIQLFSRSLALRSGSQLRCPSAETLIRASPLGRPPSSGRRLRVLLGLAATAGPMKKILNFAKRRRGASPSASETGSLTSAGGYELRDRDLSKLHRAAYAGDLPKVRQLCKKHDPNQQDKERRTPLHLACANGHSELVTYLVENQSKINLCDNDSRSPLMKAVQCQQESCATILLEHDADPNLMDINGNTALHFSARIPSVSFSAKLLEHGAHIDAQNKEGCTPLLLAVSENHQDMVDFLLKQGADINAKDKSKRTPLMIAASSGQIGLVKLLVQNDADTFLKDDTGWTCDDYAHQNGHHACSHLIIEHRTKQNQISSSPFHGASKIKGVSMFSSPDKVFESGFQLGGPALDRDVTDDISQAESESRHSNQDASIASSWNSSDAEEELEFSPKKSQKPSLAVLMNASMQTKKAGDNENYSNENTDFQGKLSSHVLNVCKTESCETAEDSEEDEKDEQEEDGIVDVGNPEESQDDYDEEVSQEDGILKDEEENEESSEILKCLEDVKEIQPSLLSDVQCGGSDTCLSRTILAGVDHNLQAELTKPRSADIIEVGQDFFQNLVSGQETLESSDLPVSFIIGHYDHFSENETVLVSPISLVGKTPSPLIASASEKDMISSKMVFQDMQLSEHLNLRASCEGSETFLKHKSTEKNTDMITGNLRSTADVDKAHPNDKDPFTDENECKDANLNSANEQFIRCGILGNVSNENWTDTNEQLHARYSKHCTQFETGDCESGNESWPANTQNCQESKEKSEGASEDSTKHSIPSRNSEPPAHDVSSNLGNSASKKVLMSELGLEEDDAESAWDSESASESPRKPTTSPLPSQAANTQMQSISEEQSGDLFYIPSFIRGPHGSRMTKLDDARNINWPLGREDFSVKIAVQKPNSTLASSQMKDDFKPAVLEPIKKQNSDLMEELGLDDADDIEDASDWDSTSTSPKHNKCFQVSKNDETSHPELSPEPALKKENKLMEATDTASPSRLLTAADMPDALTGPLQSVNEQRPENKGCSLEKDSVLLEHNKLLAPNYGPDQDTLNMLPLEDTKIAVNNGDNEDSQQENSRVLRLFKFTEKSSIGNEAQNDVSHIMLKAQLEAAELSHESEEDLSSSDSDSPWEERYEKLWVDQEKKEVKSHFKTVAAELKQKFGEIIDSPKTTPSLKSPSQICLNEMKMTSDASFAEDDCEAADLTCVEFPPIARQSSSTSQDNFLSKSHQSKQKETDLSKFVASSNIGLPTVEHLLNPLKCTDVSQNQVNSNSSVQKENKRPMLQESLINNTVRDSDSSNSMEKSQIHSLQEDDLHQNLTSAKVKGYDSSKLQTQLYVAPKNINKIETSEDIKKQKSQVLVNSNKGKLKYQPQFENLGTSQGSPNEATSKLLDKGLEQDVQRFKNEVGILQAVFLSLEKEKAQLQKEVKEEKLKNSDSQKSDEKKKKPVGWDSDNSVVQNSDKNKQLKQTLATKASVLSENEGVTSHSTNSVQMKEKSKPAQNLLRGTSSGGENTKQEKKNHTKKSSEQISAKALNQQQIPSLNGKALQVFDDSSLSETSQNEQRSLSNPGNKKDKATRQIHLADDLEDSTLSSDTATEDCDSPTSVYRNAMLLIDQLSVEGHDSVNLLKIQNIVHEYEHLMERENGRYGLLLGKVKKLESERKELQKVIEETRDLKSLLEHQKVEWESDLNSVRFTLKQEEEKRKSVEMLYDKSRDQLRKKEDQCCKEMEGRQQLELSLRNQELELRTLRNSMKQVEEERSEAQRLLSQERSARVVQEGILNNHLWRQKEEEEKKIKMITKMEETLAQTPDVSDREKELMQRNHSLQEEICVLKVELDQVRARNKEEEGKTLEENEALKEKLEDLRRDLKLNEEALTQTVFQYNGQFNALKAESAMLSSKIEHEKQSKERQETELESARSRLATALQELERSQSSKSDAERSFQREREDWLRSQDKINYDLANVREANSNLSQQLTKAEAKTNSLENELHRTTLSLREKTLVLESCQRDLNQASCRVKEFERALQIEKEQVSKCTVKQETMQERLAQIHSENMLLRQQLEDVQNKGILKEKAVNDTQDRFSDIFSKLRDDTEKKVNMVEERNKELITKTNDLREQIYKIETEKVAREAELRKVQQELVDALKKLSMSEASLEVTTQNRNSLEEEKLRLQTEIEKLKCKMQETEEIHIQSERCIHDLKNMLDDKEREVIAVSQKFHEISTVTSGTEKTVKQLEEHVQMLEIENARLEATMKQQIGKIEILQKEQQESVSIRTRLEDLITNLQSTKIGLEEQLNHQVHHQTVLSQTAKDSHNLWEEELKSRSRLGVRLAQLDREKADLAEQVESERKKVKKVLDMKRSLETRLEQEMKRNTELLKEGNAMKKLLKSAKKKLKEHENGEVGSQFNTVSGELKNNHYEAENQMTRLKAKIDDLSQNLEMESAKCIQLESMNRDLREQLSSVKFLHKNHDRLEKSKRQLEEEVANLKRHVETNMTDHNQMGQYKREIEERARQEIRQKLEEVNMFLQTQAASQETLEQIRATNDASLRNQMEHRIRDLESELSRIKSTQHDSMCQKESTQSELDRYKDLYSEEIKVRKSLAAKLDRANERLAEANAKLLNERQRSKSLLANSFVNGSLPANPFMDSNPFGTNLTLNRSIGLPGNFYGPGVNGLSSNRVEAYLAKMQMELEKNITKELDQANADLESRTIRMSPVGSTTDSLRNTTADQDPISRATQQYLDVLKKNSKI